MEILNCCLGSAMDRTGVDRQAAAKSRKTEVLLISGRAYLHLAIWGSMSSESPGSQFRGMPRSKFAPGQFSGAYSMESLCTVSTCA